MGLFNVFAKLHGKDDWSELEPWQQFLTWIEICLTPFTPFFIVIFMLELLDYGSTAPQACIRSNSIKTLFSDDMASGTHTTEFSLGT